MRFLQLENNSISQLCSAVGSLWATDIAPLARLVQHHYLNRLQGNDVVHSDESALKSAFIVAIGLAAANGGQQSSEVPTSHSWADCVYIEPTNNIGVHIEFKNVKVADIVGKATWETLNELSDEYAQMADHVVLALPLFYDSPNTVDKKLQAVKHDATTNGQDLQMKYKKSFHSFFVLRVGLRKLIYGFVPLRKWEDK